MALTFDPADITGALKKNLEGFDSDVEILGVGHDAHDRAGGGLAPLERFDHGERTQRGRCRPCSVIETAVDAKGLARDTHRASRSHLLSTGSPRPEQHRTRNPERAAERVTECVSVRTARQWSHAGSSIPFGNDRRGQLTGSHE